MDRITPEIEDDTDCLSRIDLRDDGPESGSDLPPTLYDPAALTLDPEHKARLEAQENERERLKHMGIEEARVKPDLVTSPHSPVPGIDPYHVEEQNGSADEGSPLCCCGTLELRTAVFMSCALVGTVGALSVIIGAYRLQSSIQRRTEGLSSGDSMLLRGPYAFNLSYCIGGIVLIGVTIFGFLLADQIVYGKGSRIRKSAFLIFQSLITTIIVIFLILLLLSFVGLALLARKDVYDQSHWEATIQKDPEYVCNIQKKLKCAGFRSGQCSSKTGEIIAGSNEACPGQFCIVFCRIEEDGNVNTNPICRSCRQGGNFQNCKNDESSANLRDRGCSEFLKSTLRGEYRFNTGYTFIILLCAVALLCVTAFRACCLPPLPEYTG